MQVQEIMSDNPVCCAPETNLREVAQMMVESDCGEIPVLEPKTNKPIGVITDRDITCRAVAKGKNPLDMQAREVMSSPVMTVTPEMSIEACCKALEQAQVRRAPVVDARGSCCGMIAQADIAWNAPEHETAELLKDVSRPAEKASGIRPI